MSGSRLASSIAGGWPRRWVTGWPYDMAAPVAHRQRARVTGAWFDSGYMVCVSSWVLMPYCTSSLREDELGSCGRLCPAPWCVGLRVTLMEKCAQSTLKLPSVEIGHYVHEHLVSGSSCSLSGFTLHGAMLGSTVGTCYASALEGFRCEGELVSSGRFSSCSPGALQIGEVRTVSASGCLGCYTLKSGHCFHEPRVFGSHCSLFQSCVRRFFLCQTGGVAGSPGVSTPR